MKKAPLIAALFFLFPALLHADVESVRVNATLIVASNQGSDYDLVNDEYRDQLIKLFSYSAYKQVDAYAMVLQKAERRRVDLSDGYELMLTLQGVEKGRILVQAVIRKGTTQYLDTVLSILRPGVVFVGGPPAAEGGEMIIVLETGF